MRTNSKVKETAPVFTHNGGVAQKITPIQSLERSVLSCMLFEDEFYEDGVSISKRIADLIGQVKPDQVAELALRVRGVGNLRHVPLLLTKTLINKKYTEVAELITQVIQRPDELGELIALYWKDGGKKPLSAQMKKGLAKAFEKFNEYQLGKYRGEGREISLRDVMFLVHPTPANSKMAKLYKKLANKELEASETWEKRASAGENQKQLFTDMINGEKLGALAMLRNLRNMQKAGVEPKVIRKGLKEMNIERVLPFRFITAAKYAPDYEPELEQAMFKCLDKEDKLSGTTVLLVDISGSMDAPISGKSEMSRRDAGYALGMLVREICEDARIYTFSDRALKISNRRGFALKDAMNSSQMHGGTNLGQAIRDIDKVEQYDRLIIITDEQSTDRVGSPKGRGYLINVASYRNGVGYKGNFIHIDGFSSAVIDWIKSYESMD